MKMNRTTKTLAAMKQDLHQRSGKTGQGAHGLDQGCPRHQGSTAGASRCQSNDANPLGVTSTSLKTTTNPIHLAIWRMSDITSFCNRYH